MHILIDLTHCLIRPNTVTIHLRWLFAVGKIPHRWSFPRHKVNHTYTTVNQTNFSVALTISPQHLWDQHLVTGLGINHKKWLTHWLTDCWWVRFGGKCCGLHLVLPVGRRATRLDAAGGIDGDGGSGWMRVTLSLSAPPTLTLTRHTTLTHTHLTDKQWVEMCIPLRLVHCKIHPWVRMGVGEGGVVWDGGGMWGALGCCSGDWCSGNHGLTWTPSAASRSLRDGA